MPNDRSITLRAEDRSTAISRALDRFDRDPFRVFIASRVSPKTRQTMIECLDRIALILNYENAEDVSWHLLDFQHTEAIRSKLIKQYSLATIRVTLSALKGVLKTACRLNLLSREQFGRATDWDKINGETLPAGRSLSEKEIKEIGNFCEAAKDPYKSFLKALFALMFGAGLRANEICNLSIDCYNYSTHDIRFIRKGNKEKEISLGEIGEYKDIENWISMRKTLNVPTKWLFIRVMCSGKIKPQPLTVKIIEHLCSNIVSKAELVQKFSPHDCRRTFGTALLDGGLDLATVQRFMSHKSPETTVRYDRRQHNQDAEARRKIQIWGK